MKKILLTVASLLLFAAMADAQTMSPRKKASVEAHEVPALVLQSFKRDFGTFPDDGTWTVYYNTANQAGRPVATPLWYTFTKKADAGKVEVKYLPGGQLKSYKGLSLTRETTTPTRGS